MLDAADEVAFLDDGRVVATGTHADLLDAEPGVPPRRDPRGRAEPSSWRRRRR